MRGLVPLALATLVTIACGGAGQSSIPRPEPGKFNVAFVYVGPIGDGGWTYAHDQARQELERRIPDVHTAYVEKVAEGAEARQVIQALARKGFDLIITTSFGFMDPTAETARDFPSVRFLHISGFQQNGRNLGTLMGAMESAKYLAGLVAGARAKADGVPKVGYIAPFAIAEVVRLVNATAIGVRETCPECTVEIRWIHTWFDPPKEKEAAESLLQAGCDVIVTGADTTGPIVTAAQAKRWAIGYDSRRACDADPAHCLTVPYFDWAPAYERVVKSIRAGTWKGGDLYLDVADGVVGLVGFGEGESPAEGVPLDVVPLVRQRLAEMKSGQRTRFDVFRGPLRDNKGREVLPTGATLSQEDLEGLRGVPGRKDCTVCMSWLNENVKGELP